MHYTILTKEQEEYLDQRKEQLIAKAKKELGALPKWDGHIDEKTNALYLENARIMLDAYFSAKMEGFEVPQDAIEDGWLMLEGKVTTGELVEKYKKRYGKVSE